MNLQNFHGDQLLNDETGLARFNQNGYLIVRNLCDAGDLQEMVDVILSSIEPALAPVEYEADVHYPGAPDSRQAPGGDTPRRLLHAIARDARFRNWAVDDHVTGHVMNLLRTTHIQVSQNHHNCIMTKFPGYGSETGWHQDIRYWSFDQPELVTTWLALGEESNENGSLTVIPGSHRMDFDRGQFDAALFFRSDVERNVPLMESAESIKLNAGDVMFFHCRLLHSAGQNRTDSVKLSVVFTYHAYSNRPIAGTRSAEHPDIDIRR
ncbi:MAG: phytanoyl-CoA dioxygenase family protein [Acidiferrobacterales bacterium]|nr:phytanoyl-CoA dioxygenase family protein [Acidiferrobacterales bacterium]